MNTVVPHHPSLTRRHFIGTVGLAATSVATRLNSAPSSLTAMPTLACNTYPWFTFLRREDRDFNTELARVVADMAATGFTSIEPNLEDRASVDAHVPLLAETGLTMESAYMNSELHDASSAAASIDHVVSVAAYALETFGTRMLVTNPKPISWGGPENKTETQIRTQGRALDQLGAALRAEGITLAYHNHDSELRLGAREFHHMLVSTDPANAKFCIDAHWVYRGCGNSSLALFDTLELYADRIVELHLRQSTGGVWDEAFAAESDIDYQRLFTFLRKRDIHPLLTMEQAVEDDSTQVHDSVYAHRASCDALRAMLT